MNVADLKVEQWPIEWLSPYPNNPRVNDGAVPRMVEAIKEFGFRIPIVAKSTGEVCDGHLRLKAALALGLKTVPVALADELTDAQVRAFRLLANKSSAWAEWDFDLLKAEMEALKIEDYPLAFTGFDDAELNKLLGYDGQTDPDEAPAVQERAVSRTGDLWLLGEHRLLAGDCTKAEDVAHAMGGGKPHLMVTDPPYGVEYDANWRNEATGLKFKASAIQYMEPKTDTEPGWEKAHALFEGDVAYVWHADRHMIEVNQCLTALGFEIRAQIIWLKETPTIGRGHYSYQHKPCWYAVRKGGKSHWHGATLESTVWKINRNDGLGRFGHAAQKPVDCMRLPIEKSSVEGQSVYEPFSGSGTTIIAAEMSRRHCIAVEIDPRFVDMAARRWQNFTGQQATLDGDGRTFDEIAEAREGGRDLADAEKVVHPAGSGLWE